MTEFGVHAELDEGLCALAIGKSLRSATVKARLAKESHPDVIIWVTFKDQGRYRKLVDIP